MGLLTLADDGDRLPAMSGSWRVCSQCKTAIAHGSTYWICGVSTCNRKRSALYFCAMDCWDAHLPMARHRDAWAEEMMAPTREQAAREEAGERNTAPIKPAAAPSQTTPGSSGPSRPILRSRGGGVERAVGVERGAGVERDVAPQRAAVVESSGSSEGESAQRRRIVPSGARDPNLPIDVLVVVSKLKAYIKAAGDMNTSQAVSDVLSDKLRDLCDAAIERARRAGRTTVMERDF